MPEEKTAVTSGLRRAAAYEDSNQLKYSTIFDLMPITLEATPALQFCARYLTNGRQRGKHLRTASTSIGTEEANVEATYYGTLAELLLYLWLEEKGHRPEYVLVDDRAVTQADFTLDGLRYEVKCAPPGKNFLSISERQHHDQRRQCDFYVCILFDTPDRIRICLPIPHADVSDWARMNNGHEPYYSLHRSELLPFTEIVQRADPNVTCAFFTALMSGYSDSSLRLEIRPAFPAWQQSALYPAGNAPGNWQFLTPRGKRDWFPLTRSGLEQATAHALALAGRYEVYFGVLPRNGESGKAVDVPSGFCLWCDIDGGVEGVQEAQARLEATVKSGRLPRPSFVVVSGGGLHVYWLLAAPISLLEQEDRHRFKQILKRLCCVIGGESSGAHADTSRADVASILRVPGTYNRKREQEPRPVRLLSDNELGEPHTLSWWSANLPALPAPPPSKFPSSPPMDLPACEGLLRWARTPYPEGKRHKDLAGAAAWLVRDKHIEKALAQELLLMKARASAGMRRITPEEVEAMIQWA